MANTALKKITTEAKRIRKSKPKTSWKSAVKQAGAKYRAGKIKPRKKSAKKKAVAKKRTVKRKTIKAKTAPRKVRRKKAVGVKRKKSRKKVGAVSSVAGRRRRTTKKYVKKVVYRRVGSGKDKTMKMLLFGALGVGAIYLLTRKNTNQQTYVPTGNYTRDTKAQQVISWVTAAGATASQIAALISSLNNKSDSQVDADYQAAINAGYALSV